MPFITINITGLVEAIRGINGIIQDTPETNRSIIEEATSLFERVAKEKVHVISGRTKNSTRKVSVTAKEGIIESSYGAKWEEKREGSKGAQGPHKFLTETANVVIRAMPDIIKRHYDELIRRSRSV